MLAERGLPVFGPILVYEEAVGGVSEALLTHEQLCGKHVPLTIDRLLMYEGRPLLPVTPLGTYEDWIDADGTLYLAVQEVDYCEPRAESFLYNFERGAFSEDLQWHKAPPPESDAAKRPFGFQLWAYLGETIAHALDVPRFEPASDKYVSIWYDEGTFIEERHHREWSEWTTVRASSMDRAALAVQAAMEKDARARGEWQGIIDTQPIGNAPIAARFWFGPHEPYCPPKITGEVQIARASEGYRLGS